MNNKIRQISMDLQKGKNPEENIPQLFNYMANHYQGMAKLRLAMHYYTFYESYYDDENSWSKEALQYTKQLNEMIHDHFTKEKSGVELEKAISKLDAMRKDIMNHMEVLTAYADMFQIYEYVLNRMEYRFKQEAEFVDEAEICNEISRYIFDTSDSFIVNERIKDIVGQLPVRITKQRYFDLVQDSFKPYLGGEISSLESYLYMLRSAAVLADRSKLESLYPELWEKKEQLAKVDYQNITHDVYEKAMNTFRSAVFVIEIESSVYFSLQEVVNDVYALLLCSPYSGMVAFESEKAEQAQNAAQSIVSFINKTFLSGDKVEIFDELLDQFSDLEGIQEELGVEIDMLESAFFEVAQNKQSLIESLMLEANYQVLKRSQSLLSNSLFVDFDLEENKGAVDESRLAEEANKLTAELKELFDGQNRILTRAIMANTLNKLPVFFQDQKEVMDYVRYSLERCSDIYEKIACTEIIRDIMSE